MTPKQAIAEIETLRKVTVNTLTNVPFSYKISKPSEPFCNWCDKGWSEYMPDDKSGVYLLSWPEDVLIYIGKATKDNLGAEIWGKFKKYRLTSDGKKEFYQSPFVSAKAYPNMDKETREAVQRGEVFLTILTIEPAEISSFIEVYLQTIYPRMNKSDRRLPALNQRIG